MKKILCFGDSNVFGYIPQNGGRYDKNTRWSGVLQVLLGADYQVVEAGCNNRTCAVPNPAGKMFIGCEILPEVLEKDFDFVILAIGINDLQFTYDFSLDDLKSGLENLIKTTKEKCPNSKIILLIPSTITENILESGFVELFDKTSIEKSHQLPKIYKSIAENDSIKFIDLNEIANVSEIDGLHYKAEEHTKIAKAVCQEITDTFAE